MSSANLNTFRAACRWVYWAAACSIFGWALLLRWRLPLQPFADPDTWGYLSPAMSQLLGGGWEHHLRNYVYPGFLFLLLRVFQDFRAITIVQHLLGVAAGVFFLLVWRRMREFSVVSRIPKELAAASGLFAVAVYLYAQEPIRLEMSLRPEGLVSFLVMLEIWLVVEFSFRAWLRRTDRFPFGWGLAAVGSSVFLSLTKPSLALAAAGALVPVAAALCFPFPLRLRLRLLIGSLLVAALLLIPEQFLAKGDSDSEMFLPTELFMIHAQIIYKQIAADVAADARIPYPHNWLGGVQSLLADEIAKSASHHPFATLGLNPDYLMFERTSFDAQMRRQFGGDLSKLCDFYWFYYQRTWQRRPSEMLGKIWRQMRIFYAPVCPAYRLSKSWDVSNGYTFGLWALEKVNENDKRRWSAYLPFEAFVRQTTQLANRNQIQLVPGSIRKWESYFARTYLVGLLATVMAAAWVFAHLDLRRRFGLLTALVVFFYWFNLGSCLEIAIVHTLENGRYSHVQLIFTVLAQVGTLWLLLELLLSSLPSLAEAPFPQKKRSNG